jgi:hypothetical protein
MSDAPIWARQPGEPLLWFRRFERFRLMEPTRSIVAVFREEHAEENRGKPRREATGDWYEMAKLWQWNERAAAWDAVQTAHLEQIIESERERVLLEGYAVMHRRVARLNALTEQLLGYVQDEGKVWLPDVKAVGTGEFAERVDLIQFNAALFHEIRAHLADIAAEMGERVKKKEVALTELPANVYGFDPDQDGVDLDTPPDRDEDDEDEAS